MPVYDRSPLEDPDVLAAVLHRMGLGVASLVQGLTYMNDALAEATQAVEVWRDQLEAEAANEPYNGDPWAQVHP